MNEIEIEAKLIEQEHRTYSVWHNFWVRKKEWEPDDPRRKAANISFILFWLPKPSTVVVSGSIVAILSLYLMSKQTDLLEEQNKLVIAQNKLFLDQLEQQKSNYTFTRKTQLISTIYDSNRQIEGNILHTRSIPKSSSRIRSEALAEYIEIRNSEIGTNLEKFKNTGELPVAATLFFGVDLGSAPLQNTSLNQLSMSNMTLSRTNFESANLLFMDFSSSRLEFVNFSMANLNGTNFKGASLHGADFSYADLTNIEWDENTTVPNTNLFGVKNPPKGFVEWAVKHGAVQMDDKSKWIAKITHNFPYLKRYVD